MLGSLCFRVGRVEEVVECTYSTDLVHHCLTVPGSSHCPGMCLCRCLVSAVWPGGWPACAKLWPLKGGVAHS